MRRGGIAWFAKLAVENAAFRVGRNEKAADMIGGASEVEAALPHFVVENHAPEIGRGIAAQNDLDGSGAIADVSIDGGETAQDAEIIFADHKAAGRKIGVMISGEIAPDRRARIVLAGSGVPFSVPVGEKRIGDVGVAPNEAHGVSAQAK